MQHGFLTRKCFSAGALRRVASSSSRGRPAHAATRGPLTQFRPDITNLNQLADVEQSFDIDEMDVRDAREQSYVSRRRLEIAGFDINAVDSVRAATFAPCCQRSSIRNFLDGLPLVYNEQRIADFWKGRPGELASRWTRFARIAVPWLTSVANSFIRGSFQDDQRKLARSAVSNLTELGPTFVKLGQILSIRPDVLPPPIMEELGRLQDSIESFSTKEAREVVEADLGQPIDELFSEFSAEPVAAASLAQVYRARLRSSGEEVAVKVQRPGALATISKDPLVMQRGVCVCNDVARHFIEQYAPVPVSRKDLYVMRRGVGVYSAVVRRFTAQTTDYQRLLSTFAEGLYTEMDFRNEALNMTRMQALLDESDFDTSSVVIPQPHMEFTSRRVLTMDWVTGVKLTTLPPAEIQTLSKIGQEAFLTQLLDVGFMHGDPHPGNLLKVTEGPYEGKLVLLDFGLVAEIPAKDREAMVSAVIHLANRDWDALCTDFARLDFLPDDADRGLIVPVMDRLLTPYLRGGGARSFNFQALSQDLLSATLEIPFSVPPYMSLLARAVATLEGIALMGDPQYQMVAQAYPFVVRKVLRNDSSSSTAVLRDILFDTDGALKATRLSTLLNAALGYVADKQGGFIDFDAVPDDGATLQDTVTFLLSKEAADLRPMLVNELTSAADLFLRDRARKAYVLFSAQAQPRLPFIGALPAPPLPPIFLPGRGFLPPQQFVDTLFPALSEAEGIQLETQLGLAANILGSRPEAFDLDFEAVRTLISQPSAQLRELQDVAMRSSGNAADVAVVRAVTMQVASNVVHRLSERAGVPRNTLFPALPAALQAEERWFDRTYGSRLPEAERRSAFAQTAQPIGATRNGASAPQSAGSGDMIPDPRAGSGAIAAQRGDKPARGSAPTAAPSNGAAGVNAGNGALGAAQRQANGAAAPMTGGRMQQGRMAPGMQLTRAYGSDASSSSESEASAAESNGTEPVQKKKKHKPVKMIRLDLPDASVIETTPTGTTKVRGRRQRGAYTASDGWSGSDSE